jgi:putative ABC transport system ATP-binding protein
MQQAIIVVTHDAKAAAYADRIIFLRDGQVVRELHLEANDPPSKRLRMVVDTMEDLEQ